MITLFEFGNSLISKAWVVEGLFLKQIFSEVFCVAFKFFLTLWFCQWHRLYNILHCFLNAKKVQIYKLFIQTYICFSAFPFEKGKTSLSWNHNDDLRNFALVNSWDKFKIKPISGYTDNCFLSPELDLCRRQYKVECLAKCSCCRRKLKITNPPKPRPK